ncbi:group II intron reverse transcriptase/maturase [Clostridium botulinum]|uniref:group II intron reverse transcriptase/maturase n=1 Tax=Clostridium botulinum TaxID=1491 RepID=UPI003890FFA4
MTHTIKCKEKILKKRSLRNNEYYDMQREFDKLYLESKKGKSFNNLMPLITSDDNLKLAFRNIKSNKGSKTYGTDMITIKEIKEQDIEKYIIKCKNKFSNFHPSKVRRIFIPKGDGRKRPLGIPTIHDRIIQQAIKQIIEPICEARFHDNSYGFRPNRSTHHAIAKYMQYANRSKLHYVVDIDIKGFFDNVDHSKLLKQMWTIGIRDKNLLSIISKMLKCEIEGEGIAEKGTPQGGILSPLLSNIVLNELDWWIDSQWTGFPSKKNYDIHRLGVVDKSNKYRALRNTNLKEIKIVRYADDFKIMCRTYEDAQRIYIATKEWLKNRLSLEISPIKSKVTNLRKGNSEFLGFKLRLVKKKSKMVIQSNMTDKAKKTSIKNIKQRIKFLQGKANLYNIQQYNSTVLGIQNYYCYATECTQDLSDIDFVIRKCIENRLLESCTLKGKHSETYKRIYKKYKGKSYFVKGVNLFPIYAMKHRNPMNFNTKVSDYTDEGREIIHNTVKGLDIRIVRYMISNPITTRSVEYNDNRISLFYGQLGKCNVTKQLLRIGNFECHHKIPVGSGGTDEYKNLILVTTDVHKVIHATDKVTIDKYVERIKPDSKMLKRINSLRKLVGNDEI